jgi:hypothetical protein
MENTCPYLTLSLFLLFFLISLFNSPITLKIFLYYIEIRKCLSSLNRERGEWIGMCGQNSEQQVRGAAMSGIRSRAFPAPLAEPNDERK